MAAWRGPVRWGIVIPGTVLCLIFLALGWVGTWIPSTICGALSLITVTLLLTLRGGAVRHELATRLHL